MASNGKPSSPHGDPLRDEIEPNMAQRQRDAPPDERIGEPRGDLTGSSDRAGGRRSTGGGVRRLTKMPANSDAVSPTRVTASSATWINPEFTCIGVNSM